MRRRYPTLESIQESRLILKHEVDILKVLAQFEDESKCSLYVVNWAIYLVREAKDGGHFEISNDVARILDPILAFKKASSNVLKFRVTEFPIKFLQVINFFNVIEFWINYRLKQLVTIAVFGFGAVTLMGMQFVDPAASEKKLFIESMYYLPILPSMQVSWAII